MSKYLIFSDIDGTICYNRPNIIPESTIQAMKSARENGHKIFLCTGRSFVSIDQMLLDLPINGMVLCCGAQVIYNDNVQELTPIPKKLLITILDYFIKHEIGFSLECPNKNLLFNEGYEVFKKLKTLHLEEHLRDEYLRNRGYIPFNEIKEEDYEQGLKVSFYSNKVKEIQYFLDHMDSRLDGYFDHMFKDIESGEILLNTTTKAYGIDVVRKKYNIDIDHVIAIGDGLNDLPMINHAGIGIAMGNSVDKLKEVADYVTDNVDNDGFEKAFKHYKLI